MKFEILKGKILTRVDGKAGDDEIVFHCSDGTKFKQYHSQDCCEIVTVESIVGDIADLIGSPILVADESSSKNEDPPGYVSPNSDCYRDHFTWTFYKLATIKGYVDIRCLGESNGWYSESVDFEQVT